MYYSIIASIFFIICNMNTYLYKYLWEFCRFNDFQNFCRYLCLKQRQTQLLYHTVFFIETVYPKKGLIHTLYKYIYILIKTEYTVIIKFKNVSTTVFLSFTTLHVYNSYIYLFIYIYLYLSIYLYLPIYIIYIYIYIYTQKH